MAENVSAGVEMVLAVIAAVVIVAYIRTPKEPDPSAR